jgi:Transposase
MCARSLVTDVSAGCSAGACRLKIDLEDGDQVAALRNKAFIGVDIGKTHHWVCVLDAEGKKLASTKITNDEADIVKLITAASKTAQQLVWAVDIIGSPSALILTLLARAGHSVRYASGRVVAAMSTAYAGEGKTDAKDAYVIAETAGSARISRSSTRMPS